MTLITPKPHLIVILAISGLKIAFKLTNLLLELFLPQFLDALALFVNMTGGAAKKAGFLNRPVLLSIYINMFISLVQIHSSPLLPSLWCRVLLHYWDRRQFFKQCSVRVWGRPALPHPEPISAAGPPQPNLG